MWNERKVRDIIDRLVLVLVRILCYLYLTITNQVFSLQHYLLTQVYHYKYNNHFGVPKYF